MYGMRNAKKMEKHVNAQWCLDMSGCKCECDANANAASGSLHAPISVNVNENAIEQRGTLNFLNKFGARRHDACRICILHIWNLSFIGYF